MVFSFQDNEFDYLLNYYPSWSSAINKYENNTAQFLLSFYYSVYVWTITIVS